MQGFNLPNACCFNYDNLNMLCFDVLRIVLGLLIHIWDSFDLFQYTGAGVPRTLSLVLQAQTCNEVG